MMRFDKSAKAHTGNEGPERKREFEGKTGLGM